MGRRTRGLVIVSLALLAGACSSATTEELAARHGVTVDAVPDPADTGPHPAAEVLADDYWAHLELPQVFSDVRVVGDVVLFEVVEEREVSLVGLDATSGEIRYRYPTHPFHRLRGVASTLLVSEEHGIVVRTDVTDNDGLPDAHVYGHDIESGEARWVVQVDAVGYPAFDCGGTFCLRSEGRQFRHDYETGEILDAVSIPGDGFFYVVLDNGFLLSETDDAFVGSADFGMGPSWRLPFTHVGTGFNAFNADRHDGWGVAFDGDAGAVYWSVVTTRSGQGSMSGPATSCGRRRSHIRPATSATTRFCSSVGSTATGSRSAGVTSSPARSCGRSRRPRSSIRCSTTQPAWCSSPPSAPIPMSPSSPSQTGAR